jgi:neutral ceramidase
MFKDIFRAMALCLSWSLWGCDSAGQEVPAQEDDSFAGKMRSGEGMHDAKSMLDTIAPAPSIGVDSDYPYLIGAGLHDTTGPCAEVMFAGYSDFNQKGRGIYMRTRSRAFVIADGSRRVALVTVDVPLMSSGVHYEVIRRLKQTFGELYTEQNVVLSATHTHSAPGGFFKTQLLNLFTGMGFSRANFDAIVNGIFESIVKAHNNLAPGKIVYNAGEFSPEIGKRLNRNRSVQAYMRNSDVEDYKLDDERYDDTNRTLAALRFIREDGREIGVYHWLPHHPNISGSHLFLINGDVNGLASYQFEKEHGADYAKDDPFVASFAYTNAADSSGNLPEDIEVFNKLYPQEGLHLDARGSWIADGSHDGQRMALRAETVMNLAQELYDSPGQELAGPVEYRQMFVHMPRFAIRPEFISDSDVYYGEMLGESRYSRKLCDGAAGVSFIAGSMEDGDSGMVPQEENPRQDLTDYSSFDFSTLLSNPLPNIASILLSATTNASVTRKEMDCQLEKTIAITLDEAKKISPEGKAWNLDQPVQIVRIGQIGIIALPVEVTLMAGRQLKDELSRVMPELSEIQINSTSNGAGMYLTTRDEYASQQYEGGANFLGPYTLNAVRQMVSDLGKSFHESGSVPDYAVSFESVGENLLSNPWPRVGEVIADGKFLSQKWGGVISDAKESYAVSQDVYHPTVVSVRFVGAHPNNDLKIQETFLEVLRIERTQDGQKRRVVVARDWDPETRFIWQRDGIDRSIVTVEWEVPPETPGGFYQIAYYGNRRAFLTGKTSPIVGYSRVFRLE